MIKGGSAESPLYALHHTEKATTIFIDTESGLIACIRRIYLQLIGVLDYNFKHVTAHVAKTVDVPLKERSKIVKLGHEMSLYNIRLIERDNQIMRRLSKIEANAWQMILDFGYELLQISSSRMFTTHDAIELKTTDAKMRHASIIAQLAENKTIRDNCIMFMRKCPSLKYGRIVRLALRGAAVNALSLKDALSTNSTSMLIRI